MENKLLNQSDIEISPWEEQNYCFPMQPQKCIQQTSKIKVKADWLDPGKQAKLNLFKQTQKSNQVKSKLKRRRQKQCRLGEQKLNHFSIDSQCVNKANKTNLTLAPQKTERQIFDKNSYFGQKIYAQYDTIQQQAKQLSEFKFKFIGNEQCFTNENSDSPNSKCETLGDEKASQAHNKQKLKNKYRQFLIKKCSENVFRKQIKKGLELLEQQQQQHQLQHQLQHQTQHQLQHQTQQQKNVMNATITTPTINNQHEEASLPLTAFSDYPNSNANRTQLNYGLIADKQTSNKPFPIHQKNIDFFTKNIDSEYFSSRQQVQIQNADLQIHSISTNAKHKSPRIPNIQTLKSPQSNQESPLSNKRQPYFLLSTVQYLQTQPNAVQNNKNNNNNNNKSCQAKVQANVSQELQNQNITKIIQEQYKKQQLKVCQNRIVKTENDISIADKNGESSQYDSQRIFVRYKIQKQKKMGHFSHEYVKKYLNMEGQNSQCVLGSQQSILNDEEQKIQQQQSNERKFKRMISKYVRFNHKPSNDCYDAQRSYKISSPYQQSQQLKLNQSLVIKGGKVFKIISAANPSQPTNNIDTADNYKLSYDQQLCQKYSQQKVQNIRASQCKVISTLMHKQSLNHDGKNEQNKLTVMINSEIKKYYLFQDK